MKNVVRTLSGRSFCVESGLRMCISFPKAQILSSVKYGKKKCHTDCYCYYYYFLSVVVVVEMVVVVNYLIL